MYISSYGMTFISFVVLEAHVELLVRAHDCFTLACNMEGISEVLRIARLCTLQLINAKAYSLMVMLFCFYALCTVCGHGLVEIVRISNFEKVIFYFVKSVFGF